jgi:NADP-dependent 3-hydroxy acid dehydrogenase YdfG
MYDDLTQFWFLGVYTLPTIGVYCMSKHATRALADILRCELSQWGVSVHDIQPGLFRQVVSFELKET